MPGCWSIPDTCSPETADIDSQRKRAASSPTRISACTTSRPGALHRIRSEPPWLSHSFRGTDAWKQSANRNDLTHTNWHPHINWHPHMPERFSCVMPRFSCSSSLGTSESCCRRRDFKTRKSTAGKTCQIQIIHVRLCERASAYPTAWPQMAHAWNYLFFSDTHPKPG